MRVKEIIKNAESYNIVHAYGDGTFLYDIGIGDKAYSIRIYPAQLKLTGGSDESCKNHPKI